MQIITRTEAKAQGLKRYFTGKPCKHGHIDERLVCDGSCKTCANLKKQRKYNANPQRYKDAQKARYNADPQHYRDNAKRWYQDNTERAKTRTREYTARMISLDPDFHKKNHAKRDKTKVRQQQNAYRKERMANDPAFKMACAMRSYVWKVLKTHSVAKKEKLNEYLGCDLPTLVKHLEDQFADGMSWANYGQWHHDHIIPVNAFDLSKEADRAKCFHYTNLQPLWAADNLSKRASLDWSKDNA